MKQNKPITIVVASDNHFVVLIAALLKSIDLNHKTDEHINFYIIEDHISTESKSQLEKIVSPERISIKWVKSKEIVPHNVFFPVDSSSFPISIFFRLFAPYIIDETLEKLIYLDVDTIVQDDISKLWNISLNEHTIGAVQDYSKTIDCEWAGIPNYAELGLSPDTKYFNSGVLLINPKKWREEDITNKVIAILIKYKKYVRMADQYGLNVVFANKWLELDPKWNWFALYKDENPSLIHFVEIKPIFLNYKFNPTFKDEFYRYLSLTPWKNFTPISGNWRLLRKIQNKLKKILLKLI
ncbi:MULTISPECIES: glycosyltransferase family 8 protein [unclassified Arcicella]|uniref:glycosyltransferase family 8 protein n=1 Tax=unclassified Arcicella TaxID=2644986 RepID=UPI00285688DF|nr:MULTISPECIES: glycosyltransferase family 8 protein [unclassified Arcicella]MDR6561625.1 lipopolysaccharide biosynthesis glycosyltransferase [Arcicella sp. BE51]MDR6812405.1 lipopolysaccharide biosynthesis glycosyltransferase [Arcicella sp. BE140]MDR6823823.1 lipopolysaccharide biosynthesis glycosyltransferase [Arcicella sp. BE139]